MARRSARRLAVLVTATALGTCLPTAAAADGGEGDGEGSPGAPGIGDPYFPLDGNGGYDVGHYGLDLRYDPATDVLSGVATISAVATQDLSAFNLDLEGLEVSSVTVDGAPAAWSRNGAELTVVPGRTLHEEEGFAVAVTYAGVPETIQGAFGISGFMHTDDGLVVAGEPHGAATWFPANDHPRDAAALDVAITVPEGLEGISNGVLCRTSTEDGWTTWEWQAREPMTTYLVTLAVGEFELREYEAGGVRYWDAIDPDLYGLDLDPQREGPSVGELAEASLDRQPEIVDFLSETFGPYPFGAAGGIVDDLAELGFALETQTRPVYSPTFFFDPISGDLVVVHELAHQWAGDLVRLDAWQHIWLNEGFASYAEWLWLEREGLVTPQQQFDDIAAFAPPEFWQIAIGDPGPETERLFDIAVYYRGAMTLQALRTAVGDEAFFAIVAEWIARYGGRSVTTEDFVGVAEEVSGRQLDGLFATWLGAGRPAELGPQPEPEPLPGPEPAPVPEPAPEPAPQP